MTTSSPTFAPDWASPPGDTLRDVLRGRGMTVQDAADAIGMHLDDLRRLLTGEAEIDLGLAQALASSMGASPQFWINRECQYRDGIARRDLYEWASRLPTKEMAERRWIPTRLDSDIPQLCLDFFQVPDLESWKERTATLAGALYRTSLYYNLDDHAALVWIQQARRLSLETSAVDKWDEAKLRSVLLDARKLTFEKDPGRFVPKLQQMLAGAGVRLVVLRVPKHCPVSGASLPLEDGSALIVLSARHLADDHFWFTLFHESGHLILHGPAEVYVDAMEEGDSPVDARELEADDFAGGLLVPQELLAELPSGRKPRSREIVRAAIRHKVAPGVVVGYLQHAGVLGYENLNSLKRRYRWNGASLEKA